MEIERIPLSELRYIDREEKHPIIRKYRTLQQRWLCRHRSTDSKFVTYEWVDVPVVEEENEA